MGLEGSVIFNFHIKIKAEKPFDLALYLYNTIQSKVHQGNIHQKYKNTI